MPLPGSTPLRRALIAAGGALAIAVAAAPAAQADFTIAPCAGEQVDGTGSSFQNAAITQFKSVFAKADPLGCGQAAPNVNYVSLNSGGGRAALGSREAGNTLGKRDPVLRFGGTDAAPNNTQRAQIEQGEIDANGINLTTADDNKVHAIPIAIGAIAIAVNLPANCNYTGAGVVRYRNRPTMSNVTLERVWWGEITTWGDAIPGLDAACAAAPIKRVVREDSSGTTTALRQFLSNINPNHNWAGLGNQEWKQDAGFSDVVKSGGDGGGTLRSKLAATPGGIGYMDLATARGGTGSEFTWINSSDVTFWLPIQHQNSAEFDDPQADPDGYKKDNPARGANCAAASPRAALPADSFGDWSKVDYSYSSIGYGACTLTYDLAFDDPAVVYCKSATEERRARTLKDFFQRAVLSPDGQNALLAADYDRLPADALPKATAAVASMGWNKNGQGRPCPGDNPNPGDGGNPNQNPNPGGSGQQPPPPPPSNAFTLASSRAQSTSLRLSLQLPGAGKVVVSGTAKPKKGASVKLAAKTVTVSKAGTQAITIALSSKAKASLKKNKKLTVKLTIVFTPNGGTPKTVTKSVTVKQPKTSKKK